MGAGDFIDFKTIQNGNRIGISVSEVHKKTGAEIVSNCIMRRNLGTKQKVPSPNFVPQYHWIRVRHQSF